MGKCSVKNCSNYHGKKGSSSRYFKFPTNLKNRIKWVNACGQQDPINTDTKRICSEHFTANDFELRDVILNLPENMRRLKKNAVPNKNLPKANTTKNIMVQKSQDFQELNTSNKENRCSLHTLNFASNKGSNINSTTQTERRGGGGVGSSSSSAQANANSAFSRPGQFGASAANAQAQGFQSRGPLGSFGASAANTQTQSFTAGRGGIQGSAGASGSQTYNLPNGKTVSVTFANGFSVGPNGRPAVSNGHSVAVS